MAYALINGGSVSELIQGRPFIDADGVSHPAEALTGQWSDAERAAIGVKAIVEPDPIPDGKQLVSSSVVLVGTIPTRQQVLEDIPLADLKAARVVAAEAEYEARIAVGYPVTLGGNAETLQLRPNTEDRTNWLGVLVGAQAASALGNGSADYPTKIRTTSNAGYTITNDAAVALMFQLLGWAGEMFGARSAIKDAIAAATDAEALAAIDVTAGYP